MKNITCKLFLGFILFFPAISVSAQIDDFLIQSNDKFTKDAVIQDKSSEFAYIYKPDNKKKYKFEIGKLNDVNYEFNYTDGKGFFLGKKNGKLDLESLHDNWVVLCSKDLISDSKTCTTTIHNLVVLLTSSGSYGLRIGLKTNGLDSYTAIRIDTNEAFTSNDGGRYRYTDINNIIEQLKKGNKVTVRFTKPYEDNSTTEQFDLYGFNEVLQFMNWAISKIK